MKFKPTIPYTIAALVCAALVAIILWPGLYLAGRQAVRDRLNCHRQSVQDKARNTLEIDLKEFGLPAPPRSRRI